MKVFLSTLGCKLNESELEAWARQFAAQGAEIVQDAREADLMVVNTCTVTTASSRKSRSLVKRLARTNENAPIVVTGCYATMSPEEARSLPNVAMVVPNKDKDQLLALAGRMIADSSYNLAGSGCRMPEAASGELLSEYIAPLSPARNGVDATSLPPVSFQSNSQPFPHPRTRAFVKIEDGCNMSCAYCIIPLARGRAQSRPRDEIVAEIARLAESGYQEVVLTGVQISDYQLEEREAGRGRLRGLCSLVRDILDRTPIPRLRLTSIAPWDLDDELLEMFVDARLCRHLHLSLQSGSTTVLRRMRRPYTAEQFAKTVERARSYIAGVGVTTDVIVGFPGESEAEFEESLKFVEQMQLARVHVFPYSPRAGTIAAQLPLQVQEAIKEARAQTIQRVADQSLVKFAEHFIGSTLPVLYESGRAGDRHWSGYSDNYIHLTTYSDENLANVIVPTVLERVVPDGARGTPLRHSDDPD